MLEKKLSASTVNVRLSAVRKLIGEARHNGIIDAEEAANLAGFPNLSQKGTRVGNWLTREQAKDLLTVPDRSKIKGKRDYAILALLLGCALRRQELPIWKLTVSRCGRADGSCPIFVEREAESEPWQFHSGSSTESTPG
jgi:site-specific recombinase XerD